MENYEKLEIGKHEFSNIIIWGAGKIGKKCFPSIIKKYKVLYWIDNDKKLWGQKIFGFEISPPSVLHDNKFSVLLTVGRSVYSEIVSQLNDFGIQTETIYRTEYSERKKDIDVIPLLFDHIKYPTVELERYDLMNKKFCKEDSLGVVIFCTSFTVYVIMLISEIKKRYSINITLITKSCDYLNELNNLVEHIYCFETYSDFANILLQLPKCNVFQSLWIEPIYADFYMQIRNTFKFLFLFVGGSDLYRADTWQLKNNEKLITVSDGIGVEIKSVKNDFLKVYPNAEKKISIVRYGLEYIDNCNLILGSKREILKNNGLPLDKIIVVCAHNAFKENRHKELIATLKTIDKKLLDKCFFIFPMTYGDSNGSYIDEIQCVLEESNLNFRILKDFMTFQKLAEFISITDIHIKVQTTDALSSTLLEYMYAGAVVITGDWLPYQPLMDIGIYYETVEKIKDVAKLLPDVVNRIGYYKEKSMHNKSIIYDMSSWDNCAKMWMEFWRVNMDTASKF